MNTQLKTLMGLSVSELQTQLDAEFPAAAYKRIPGAMDLTDIDPAYMRRCITKVFGLCGVGWGYRFDPQAVQIREAGNKGLDVAITDFVFWYKLTDGTAEHVFEIPVVGGSVNKTTAYALKGALTYCIGHAVSNLGFQESVYMGLRSHATTRTPAAKRSAKAPAKPARAKQASPTRSSAPAKGAAIPLELARGVTLPFGTKHHPDYKGKTLAELEQVDSAFVTWLAQHAPAPDLKNAAGVLISAR